MLNYQWKSWLFQERNYISYDLLSDVTHCEDIRLKCIHNGGVTSRLSYRVLKNYFSLVSITSYKTARMRASRRFSFCHTKVYRNKSSSVTSEWKYCSIAFIWWSHYGFIHRLKVRTTLYSIINRTTWKYCSIAFIRMVTHCLTSATYLLSVAKALFRIKITIPQECLYQQISFEWWYPQSISSFLGELKIANDVYLRRITSLQRSFVNSCGLLKIVLRVWGEIRLKQFFKWKFRVFMDRRA